MEHHNLDAHTIPKDSKPLFINEPWLIDPSLQWRQETGYDPAPLDDPDNIRVYVPLDLCKESILRRLSNRRRIATVRIWNKHVSVAKHEPHDVELRVGIVDLGDDLVAHLFVPAVEQLRQGGTRYVARVGKLGVGNPVLV